MKESDLQLWRELAGDLTAAEFVDLVLLNTHDDLSDALNEFFDKLARQGRAQARRIAEIRDVAIPAMIRYISDNSRPERQQPMLAQRLQ